MTLQDELKQRADDLGKIATIMIETAAELDRRRRHFLEMRDAEHALSASYVRISKALGLDHLPSMSVEEMWEMVEVRCRDVVLALKDYDREMEAIAHLADIDPMVAQDLAVLRQRHAQALGATRL